MPLDATPENVHAAIEYAMAVHLQEHAAAVRVQGLTPPQSDCQTCGALVAALAVAHQLVETPTATPRRRART
jgi:hypothetical protein